jgi:iron complex transport system substrate-binding protein
MIRPLIALLASSALAAGTAAAQTAFTDDAGRSVVLPATVERVFAAGTPADLLLYTLVPEKLPGRNQIPGDAQLQWMPPEYRTPRQIVNLPERDDPRYDAEMLALDVDVYVDYGTIDDDYVAALEAISERTKVPALILDGSLEKIPSVYRRLGSALGASERGERLAREAERIIGKYRGALAAPPVDVYLACSPNGLTPCVEGHSSAEAAALLGARNVGGRVGSARGALTVDDIAARAPDIVIATNKAAAETLRTAAEWQKVAAVPAGRVYAPPELPFNWGPRPPSVNRLAGVIWLAYVARGRPFDDEFQADVRRLFEAFYHVTPTAAQLDGLVKN